MFVGILWRICERVESIFVKDPWDLLAFSALRVPRHWTWGFYHEQIWGKFLATHAWKKSGCTLPPPPFSLSLFLLFSDLIYHEYFSFYSRLLSIPFMLSLSPSSSPVRFISNTSLHSDYFAAFALKYALTLNKWCLKPQTNRYIDKGKKTPTAVNKKERLNQPFCYLSFFSAFLARTEYKEHLVFFDMNWRDKKEPISFHGWKSITTLSYLWLCAML